MRIACVGAGPAGLYFAMLVMRRRRAREVVVFEKNRPDETFGFGVVFSDPTLDRLRAEDPETCDALLERSERWNDIELHVGGGVVRCGGQGFSAISRKTLLALLQDGARRCGVTLRFEAGVDDPAALGGFDLVVAADGAGSPIRRRYFDHFRPAVDIGKTKYIWFGTTRRFESLTFLFRKHEHGVFAVHAYPFERATSTFIVETDEASWRRAGLDAPVPKGEGDERARAYLERLFAEELAGCPLVSNRSRWQNFRTVRTPTWTKGPLVLMGDAAHTAHFSVGSGTKMAMEDALALAAALGEHTEVGAACEAYERARRHEVESIQHAAGPSLVWWENFRHYVDLAPEQFGVHFLTRNLKLTRASLERRDPAFVARADAWMGTARASDAPWRLGGTTFKNRIARAAGKGAKGSALVFVERGARADAEGGARLALLVSDASQESARRVAEEAQAAGVDLLELVDTRSLARYGVFPPALFAAVRAAWPRGRLLGVRLITDGLDPDEAVAWAAPLAKAGCDLVTLVPSAAAWERASPRAFARTVLCSDRIRNELRLPTVAACGPLDADTVVLSARADMCLVSEG